MWSLESICFKSVALQGCQYHGGNGGGVPDFSKSWFLRFAQKWKKIGLSGKGAFCIFREFKGRGQGNFFEAKPLTPHFSSSGSDDGFNEILKHEKPVTNRNLYSNAPAKACFFAIQSRIF